MPPGFRRSRALWDEARRPNAPRFALLRAILYELQPVRFSSIDLSGLGSSLRAVWSGLSSFATETVPSLASGSYELMRNMSRRHWMVVGGVVVYYNIVRWVHSMLDAGPLLVITTALVLIFTVGLGDTATQDGVSAYSVFNRGFERILGTVDAEALVQQHVGGAMGLAAAGGIAPPRPEPEDAPIHREPVARQRQDIDNGQDENVARAENGDDNDDAPERGSSRKSGKKARRRNLEQKRELQRQREAAIAMGFTGDEGQEEMMAMQRLLEEQIAANNGQQD